MLEARSFSSLRPGVSAVIAGEVPCWAEGAVICKTDLARFRRLYIERLLEGERGELDELDRQVIASLELDRPISQNTEEVLSERISFGERLADKVSEFGGSWTFIVGFLVLLVAWMTTNALLLGAKPFDPYPFILLNLLLSCVAAFQAPIIMMSQRRKDAKDRLRAENDYRVNLKSELEIRLLHEKIDHQLAHQWKRLAELQQIQIDLLEEAVNDRR
ncbi:DUF1003 domain-containing protein [Roseobacter sp. GAI101]|uniref:DUF1003 domain-containing protein n=1 Tax=Roseobacter sp. (strain GAI101) TaxID=391589 RepID=UPI000187183D|nr:DUF1003 domain-containing protein [Roseobacter sp. GAI101]EEB84277.1 cyclic nucleotide-binding protein [Roseobacter sp. GAI101]